MALQKGRTNGQGFACGWAYWFAQAMSVAAQLVAASNTLYLWLPYVPREIWILVIFVIIFVFNNFNVRRYGEIEYWLTVIKVITIMGIIVAGVLLPMNASPNQRLLGTNNAGNPVACNDPSNNYTCIAVPGFECTVLFIHCE
jgi:amino acid permease